PKLVPHSTEPNTMSTFPSTTLFRSPGHRRRTRFCDGPKARQPRDLLRPGRRLPPLLAGVCAPEPSSRTDRRRVGPGAGPPRRIRSEEHTSELQSRENIVCRLLLEKK